MTRLLHPRYWGYHLVVAVALVAAGLLGLWQYHGWQERRDAEARDLTQVAPIPLADAIGPDDPFPGQYVGQPVEVHGTWVPAHRSVSGREHEGREGYWVVDPVRVGASLLPVVAAGSRSPGGVPRAGAADVTWSAGSSPPRAPRPPTTTRTTTCFPAAPGGRPGPALRRGPVRRVRRRRATRRPAWCGRPRAAARRRAGSPPSATCCTPWSGGSSAPSPLFIWWRWARRETVELRRRRRHSVGSLPP